MNYVNVELDAYEISERIFSDNSQFNKNFSFENVDIRTFFEMLLIITIEGLKKFYGDENKKVNITLLNISDIEKINKYLDRINVKLNFRIYDHLEYSFLKNNSKLKNFTEMEINENTPLNTINYIINRQEMNLVYLISFDFT